MANKVIAMIMVVVVMLGVGIPTFISVITPVTTPTYVAGEHLTAANNTGETVAHPPIDYSVAEPVIKNGTTTLTKGQNYTLYVLNADNSSYNGTVHFINIPAAFGASGYGTIDYYYQQQGYSDNALVKVILQLLPLAFAVVALIMIFMMMG